MPRLPTNPARAALVALLAAACLPVEDPDDVEPVLEGRTCEGGWIDTSECGYTPAVFTATLVDVDDAFRDTLDVDEDVGMIGEITNPTDEPITLSSPDCLLKGTAIYGADGGVVGTLDCFRRTSLTIDPGATVREGRMPPGPARSFGPGLIAGALTYWFEVEGEVRMCEVCADGVEVVE